MNPNAKTFLQALFQTIFQAYNGRGANVAPIQQVRASTMLLLLAAGR
jgi:hypothetical protein